MGWRLTEQLNTTNFCLVIITHAEPLKAEKQNEYHI